MKCPRCQHENRSGAKFCEECAAPLARTCMNCGGQLSATAKFCAECAHGVAVTPGPLASPESYTPKDLLGRGIFKPTVEGTRKQVTVPSADMKGSIEFVGDEMHMARPSEGASPPDTGRAQGPGIPRIAIGTGAALVALLIVALYTWLPTALAPLSGIGPPRSCPPPARRRRGWLPSLPVRLRSVTIRRPPPWRRRERPIGPTLRRARKSRPRRYAQHPRQGRRPLLRRRARRTWRAVHRESRVKRRRSAPDPLARVSTRNRRGHV